MDPRTLRAFSDHLCAGGSVVAAGSAAGLWLPPGIALLFLALALCRICWIEDNIHHDLLDADRVPAGYRACRRRRAGVLGRVFGDREEDEITCPRRLASALRLQAHVWAAFAWAIAAGAVFPAGVAPAAGAVALVMALRHADDLAVGASRLATGAPLARHLIAGRRGILARLATIPRRRD